MRKMMSVPEWVAVGVMLAGFALGIYGGVASTLAISRAIAGLGPSMESATTTTDISEKLRNVSSNLGAATGLRAYADIGFWIWLLGIGIFVVASRLNWNRALRALTERLADRVAPSGVDEE